MHQFIVDFLNKSNSVHIFEIAILLAEHKYFEF